jgi:hypothetical protein
MWYNEFVGGKLLNPFITRFVLPEFLYHGTTMAAVLHPDGFVKKLINQEFMRNPRSNDRDFGTGFYTTIDFRQAAEWARRKMLAVWESGKDIHYYTEEELPVIVQIRCIQADVPQKIEVLDFRGEGDAWSDFILTHRIGSQLNNCHCIQFNGLPHPQIVCGPMADNDTGQVIAQFKQEGREWENADDRRWFRQQITQTNDGILQSGLELGDQIAWFGEDLNNFLRYDGYYKINKDRFLDRRADERNYREEWDYYAGH